MKCHIQYVDKAETDLSLINNLIGNLITYQMIKRNRFCRTIQIGTHIIYICTYIYIYIYIYIYMYIRYSGDIAQIPKKRPPMLLLGPPCLLSFLICDSNFYAITRADDTKGGRRL